MTTPAFENNPKFAPYMAETQFIPKQIARPRGELDINAVPDGIAIEIGKLGILAEQQGVPLNDSERFIMSATALAHALPEDLDAAIAETAALRSLTDEIESHGNNVFSYSGMPVRGEVVGLLARASRKGLRNWLVEDETDLQIWGKDSRRERSSRDPKIVKIHEDHMRLYEHAVIPQGNHRAESFAHYAGHVVSLDRAIRERLTQEQNNRTIEDHFTKAVLAAVKRPAASPPSIVGQSKPDKNSAPVLKIEQATLFFEEMQRLGIIDAETTEEQHTKSDNTTYSTHQFMINGTKASVRRLLNARTAAFKEAGIELQWYATSEARTEAIRNYLLGRANGLFESLRTKEDEEAEE